MNEGAPPSASAAGLPGAGSRDAGAHELMRERGADGSRVTNIELFFDLVYVFAVTQLSHYLLHHLTVPGALQGAVLLAMVWLLWTYTIWAKE